MDISGFKKRFIFISIALHLLIIFLLRGEFTLPVSEYLNFKINETASTHIDTASSSRPKIKAGIGSGNSLAPLKTKGIDKPSFTNVNSQEWAKSVSIENMSSLNPFISSLANRISSHVHYEAETAREHVQGVVTVDIEVSDQGSLLTMNIVSNSSDSRLNGMLLRQIKEALSKPLPIRAHVSPVKVTISVDFSIVHTRDSSTEDVSTIDENVIKISRMERQASKYDLTEQSWDDNSFTRFFRKKKATSRDAWDLNIKTNNLARTCDIEQVDLVCFNAAQNYEILGQIKDSKKYYAIACDLQHAPSCEKLKEMKFQN